MTIGREAADSPDALRLCDALDDDLRIRYPGDEPTHFAPVDANAEGGAFLVVRDRGAAVGCVALRRYAAGVGEIKRMYVAECCRGQGLGRQLLEAVEQEARAAGYARVILETGLAQPEAMALYERSGYERIPAYGQFADHPLSVCYEKRLNSSDCLDAPHDVPADAAATVTIRSVRRDDAPALRAIYNYAVHHTTATMDMVDRSLDEQEAWIQAHNGEPYPGYVAVAGDGVTVVGYASLSPFIQRPGFRPTVEDSVYVHPDWHGRGIGRMLLTQLIESAAERGFRNILASISADNAVSLRLHRAQGFVDVGLFKEIGYKQGQWVDVAYLQLVLGEGEEGKA